MSPSLISGMPLFSDELLCRLHRFAGENPLSGQVNRVKWREETRIDFCFTAAQQEGNSYSLGETIVLLQTGYTAPGAKPARDARMITNLQQAYEEVLAPQPLSRELLVYLHRALMGGLISPRQAGEVRAAKEDALGTIFDGLRESPALGDPFNQWLFLTAGLSCLQPFEDGNKRVARCMAIQALTNQGCPPLLFHKDATPSYLDALLSFNKTGDTGLLQSFFLDGYERAGPVCLDRISAEISGALRV